MTSAVPARRWLIAPGDARIRLHRRAGDLWVCVNCGCTVSGDRRRCADCGTLRERAAGPGAGDVESVDGVRPVRSGVVHPVRPQPSRQEGAGLDARSLPTEIALSPSRSGL